MIPVRFPDGSLRDLPSELCPVDAETNGGASRFHHRPIGVDAQWRFVESKGGWLARPRHGGLAILIPPVDPWWQGIATMTDQAVTRDAATRDRGKSARAA
ncbi:hypothetical protein Q4610_13115 [Sphingobium sp. HBC34]|uniref:Uncharacterized protein n=1 Tax=Sphingobium cyanobacteriorum TaxID=3063954 RepID=A0ABT8ZP51_9SPHN|nr:hypothetical protein [Sphingobium sp. HBC34]MDO7835986.1 hypothetical protein [Sphingobium sp. HBC34]